jgi:integrase
MIFKRGGDHYWYKFMYKDALYCASTRQGSAKAAKDIEAAKRTALAKAEQGIYERTPAPTFEDFCTKEFEPRISATVGGSIATKTWDDFYLVGIKALKSFRPLATCPLDEIDAEMIGRFKVHRLNAGNVGGKQKAVSTVNSSVRVLRRILNKAVEWHKPEKGIFFLDKAPEFELMKGEAKRDYVVPLADEKAYLKKAGHISRLLADVVTVLIDSAIRPEECHRLRWENVRWASGLYGVFQVVRGKSENARRELPMSARLKEIFERRWKDAECPSEGWIFADADTMSGHIEPSTLKKVHAKTLTESKVRSFVLYHCRHTSLTRLACECREPWSVARIAGHGNIKIGQTYVHSHRMERSAWWAEWWAYVNANRKPSKAKRKQSDENLGTNLGTAENRPSEAVLQ